MTAHSCLTSAVAQHLDLENSFVISQKISQKQYYCINELFNGFLLKTVRIVIKDRHGI